MRAPWSAVLGFTLTLLIPLSMTAGPMTPLSDQESLMRPGSIGNAPAAGAPADAAAAPQLLSASNRSTKAAIRLHGMAALGQDFAASALAGWLRSPEEILGIIRPDSGNPGDYAVEAAFLTNAGLDPMGLVHSWGTQDALTRLDRLVVTEEGLIGPPQAQRVVLPVPSDAGPRAYAKKFKVENFIRNTNGGNPLSGGNLVLPTELPFGEIDQIDQIDPDLLTEDNLKTAQAVFAGKLTDAEALPDLIGVPWMRDLLAKVHDVTGSFFTFIYDNRFVLIGLNLFALAMQQLLRRRRG